MKQTIIIIIILVVLVGAAALLFNRGAAPEPEVPETVATSYSDGTTVVEATFDNVNETVTFSHPSLGETTLPRAVSASGARYANEDESLVFWEHQGELTITEDGETLFAGPAQNHNSSRSNRTEGVSNPDVDQDGQTDIEVGTTDPGEGSTDDGIIHTWVWTQTVMNDDTVITPQETGAFTLTLEADGSAHGTTDCNSFTGSYELGADDAIAFSPLAMTRMFCEGSQEAEFTDMLTEADHYFMDENGNLVLLLPFDSGSVLFEAQQ